MLHTIRGGKSPQPSAERVRHGAPIAPSADTLTDALANTERMTSILTTLLEERITDHGKGSTLSIRREDAYDIRFAAEQLLAMVARAGDIWRAIP